MTGGERKFIVTVRAETDLDVHDVQEAVVLADLPSPAGETPLGHGDVDVELIEVAPVHVPLRHGENRLAYKVLDGC